MLTVLVTVSTHHPSCEALPEAVVPLQRSHAAEGPANHPGCVLPPSSAGPQHVGFHLRLAGGFGFELTHGYFACVSCVASVLPSPSAWEVAGRERCATAACKSWGRAALPITHNQGGEARLLWTLSDTIAFWKSDSQASQE